MNPAPTAEQSLSKSHIESALAEWFGRRYCCLTNRGTTALTAALTALERPAGTRCVFPAAMCSIPVFAAPFAGWTPDFADVSLRDGNFDLDSVERVLRNAAGSVGAVVPVHMFGQPENLEALQLVCDRHGAILVEDVALSMGARNNGKKLGSFGQMSCLSFVRKMLPLEMGGAVLTDDPELDRKVREFVSQLPPISEGKGSEISAAMKGFHALAGYVAAGGWRSKNLLKPFQDEFRHLLLRSTSENDWADSVVLDELSRLDDVVGARRVRAEVYDTALNHPRLVPTDHDESCLFSYPVRLTDVVAEDFLAFASERGYNFRRIAYPLIAPIFSDATPSSFPNAEILEKELVGFPVDDNCPVSSFWEYVRDFSEVFCEYLKIVDGRPPFPWKGKLEQRLG